MNELELLRTLEKYLREADSSYDVLGYIGGEYDTKPDYEGYGLKEAMREALRQLDALRAVQSHPNQEQQHEQAAK